MSRAPISTEHLWELLSDRLRAFFARRISDQQAAEDLLQETFIRIHKGLDGLGDGQRMEPWVFRIARNLVVDHQRSRVVVAVDEESFETIDVLNDEAAAGNLNDTVRDWLPAMIDQLPDPYARAVRLYELKGVPQQEIADQLGISLSGAKSRVQRGRDKLKSLLFDCCYFERDRRGNVIGIRKKSSGDCGPC